MTLELGDTIKHIELTKEGKQQTKSIDFVSSDERVKALEDPVRIQILQMLTDGIDDTITTESVDDTALVVTVTTRQVKRHALSTTELIRLSEENDDYDPLTKNQVYHHLPVLIEHGFVFEYGTVTTGKRTTKYYKRTSDTFVTFGLHYGQEKLQRALKKEIKDALPVFKFECPEGEELSNQRVEAEIIRLNWAKEIEKIIQGDVTNRKAIELFDWFLWVYATGQEEFMQQLDKIRNALFC